MFARASLPEYGAESGISAKIHLAGMPLSRSPASHMRSTGVFQPVHACATNAVTIKTLARFAGFRNGKNGFSPKVESRFWFLIKANVA